MLDHSSSSYEEGFAGIVANVLLSWIIFIYLYYQVKLVNNVYDSSKPFCDWVWFTDNVCHRYTIALTFLVWTIPNIILSTSMSGITWLIGLYFIFSLMYWLVVVISMIYSYRYDNAQINT